MCKNHIIIPAPPTRSVSQPFIYNIDSWLGTRVYKYNMHIIIIVIVYMIVINIIIIIIIIIIGIIHLNIIINNRKLGIKICIKE